MSIFQKMMAIAGRSPSGKARALKTDENGVLETKLTSNIVELKRELNIEVQANSTFSALTFNDLLNYKKVIVLIRSSGTNNLNYAVVANWSVPPPNTFGSTFSQELILESKVGFGSSDHIETKSSIVTLQIKNNSTATRHFDIVLMGVR